jgi:hypothetical protein
MLAPTDVQLTCHRCGLPRDEWSANGEGYLKGEQVYCCRGCAEGTGCTCLEAGPAA